MAKFPAAKLEFVREDDFVEYFLYIEISPEAEADEHRLQSLLEDLRTKCLDRVNEWTKERNYIWHKDKFQLSVRTCSSRESLLDDESIVPPHSSTKEPAVGINKNHKGALMPHLHGVTHYGDNIADEWFIVFLLTSLTKDIPKLVARVIDSDGEFLLIEAAEALPKWANPDTCEQRVFIADGCVHLVKDSTSNSNQPIEVREAVALINSNLSLYKVSAEIQRCIQERTKEFESKTNDALHNQIVRLPLGVAWILKKNPSLISAAVRAFCDRDSLDLKACRSMRYFPPEERVRVNVCFTKCLYAMIMQSNYVPDRKIGWNLQGNPSSEEYKEDILGIKLACGFEIMASQAKDSKSLELSPAWKAYVRSLHAKGYFKENIEGSQEYSRLLKEAQLYFENSQARFCTTLSAGKTVLELLQSTEINSEELRDEENNLRPSDTDVWLDITDEQLDKMLLDRYGPKKMYKTNGDINVEEFTNNITEFLEKQSDYRGVVRDSDDYSTDEEAKLKSNSVPKNKVKKNHSMRQAVKKNPLNANQSSALNASNSEREESFTTQVKSFLDFVIPEDKWDSNSEMSDYEDEDDMEQNLGEIQDADIKAYMDQMDRELANTTIGKTFTKSKTSAKAKLATAEDFDDIEDFEPININVNTLKNMMDSYKSQLGGSGPVTNLLSAMGAGMSAAAMSTPDDNEDLKESAV